MNWHLLIFVIGSFFLIYIVPKLWKLGDGESKKPNDFIVKMFGGPFDKSVQRVPYEKDGGQPHFFITPYPPQFDEEGNPPQENIVGWMRNTVYVRPNYAYYQQISDQEYFYVRDLEEIEVLKLQQTGQMPAVQSDDD